ncbi:MAG: cation-translocating P-type ATPase [Parachlamydiaceae bacterium]|nr:cation-translocating P-type ATPase [Parachlamydiaceae bacterium]
MFNDPKFYWLIFICALVGILEFFELAGMHAPAWFAIPFYSLIIFGIGHETLWHGLKALATLNFKSINALMLIAVAGAFYLGQYVEAAVVICLYTLAEKLEDIGIQKSQSSLGDLLDKMPKTVLLEDETIPIRIENVKIGDIMMVKPFDIIALDGVVVSGFSYVDESTITGEPIPKDKALGDTVFAGTINKQGFLAVEVLKTKSDSTLNRLKEITLQATEKKAHTQKFIETFSQFYTPFVIALGFMVVFIPVVFLGEPFDPWLLRGLTLIVIACPCALVISTPICIYSAIGNASTHGALIKSGRDLESIGQVKAVALDKTRTLTYGKPIVSDVIPFGSGTKENLLGCAAGIEIFSEHPLSLSIVEAAKKDNLNFHKIENYERFIGKGAKADCLVCDNSHHCIGKLSFILEEHHVPNRVHAIIDSLNSQGKTTVVISTHEQVEGVIGFIDEIRPESKSLIDGLRKLQIKSVMLTGDHQAPAQSIANKLGITEIKADLLPEDKVKAIEELVKKYKFVAMVGDGVNDAPALALSNVGISIGSLGNDAALEAASIILLNDRLDMIPFLIRLGKKTINTIKFNTALAISIKLIFIGLALIGLSNLALAIFADVGVTLIVILISLRLMKWNKLASS